MAMQNLKTRFATEGFRAMRLNPDGTIPRATRFLGFTNTVDVTGVIDVSDAADLTIKIDNGTAETKSVDFTPAVSKSAVTVAEAVSVLTTAAFTGITWSADASTGRLKGVSASGTYVQVYGELAPYLDFGQAIDHGGEGLVFVKSFDDLTKSIGLPKNIKAKEEIDVEGAQGTVTRMVIAAKLQGMSPVIATKNKSYDLLEMIQGGDYDRTANTYDPPLSSRTQSPRFFIEVFSPLYSQGVSKMEDLTHYEKLLIRSCVGMEGDVPIEAKAWANYSYNVEATEYVDESSVTHPAWQESQMTLTQFEALNVETV
jgi:hypothetical protein